MPGAGGWAATDGDPATAWITPFGRPIGPTLTVPVSATTVSTIELRQPTGDFSPITQITVGGTGADVAVAVPAGRCRRLEPPRRRPARRVGRGADHDQRRRGTDHARSAVERGRGPSGRDRRGSYRRGGRGSAPAEVDLGCREVLSIDGLPATFDLGTVRISAVLAGEPIVSSSVPGPRRRDPRWGAARHDPDREPAGRRDRTRRRPRRAARPRDAWTGAGVDVDVLDQERTSRTVSVAPCPAGCWVVLGEGYNDGWVAEIDGETMAWISAPDSSWTAGSTAGNCRRRMRSRTVTFRWTPQRAVTIGLWLSGLAVVACVVLAVADRRRRPIEAARPPRLVGFGRERASSRRSSGRDPSSPRRLRLSSADLVGHS